MTFGKANNTTYILRLEKGEEIVSSMQQFCEKHNIKNATIAGIGSVDNPTLAHYQVATKKYSQKPFIGTFEVTSLLGNIALFETKVLIHAHVTIGDETMQAHAGHLINGDTSATMEITITALPSEFSKKYSEEVGLKLFEFIE